MKWTYSKAGVDLDQHSEMHKIAISTIRRISKELKIPIYSFGGYAPQIRIGNLEISLHVDGVGTKSIVASRFKEYRVIGWDCVVVNINDVSCEGLKPIAIGSYIIMPRTDLEAYREIMEGIAKASIENKTILIGGETAIMPDLVNYIDVSCSIIASRSLSGRREFNRANIGDHLVGLPSNGLHANGYSLARKIIETTIGYEHKIGENRYVWQELLKPTANYAPLVIEAHDLGIIDAAAHITGGGFRKVKRILGTDLDALIETPEPPEIFKYLMKLGNVAVEEMYRVFNMGVGMVIAIRDNYMDDFRYVSKKYGYEPIYLGEVVKGSGIIRIETPLGDSFEL